MNKICYCYHSHTYRCGHASGSDEGYILSAIKAGFKEYGISDHIFLPNIIHLGMRGDISMLDDYISSMNYLKNKYKDKIKIHIGFEAEYMKEYVDYYKDLLESKKIEYLILGQHCYYKNNNPIWYLDMDPLDGLFKYTADVVEGIKSGLFKYVAHPDLFCLLYTKWDKHAIACSKRIIEASIKYNVPLEINLCKLRASKKGYIVNDYPVIYPYKNFWDLVKEYNDAHVVVGVDSHSPQQNLMENDIYLDDFLNIVNLKVDFSYKID